MTWLLKFWPQILAALLVFGGGLWSGMALQRWSDGRIIADLIERQEQRETTLQDAYHTEVSKRETAEREARDLNRRVYADLEPKLAAAADDNRRLAARLLSSQREASARRCPIAAAPDQPGTALPAGVPDGAGAIEAATGDAFAACERDSLRLGALQVELRGQM